MYGWALTVKRKPTGRVGVSTVKVSTANGKHWRILRNADVGEIPQMAQESIANEDTELGTRLPNHR